MKTKKEAQETKKADVSQKGAEIPADNTEAVKAPGKRRGRPKAAGNQASASKSSASPAEATENTGTVKSSEPAAEASASPAETAENTGAAQSCDPAGAAENIMAADPSDPAAGPQAPTAQPPVSPIEGAGNTGNAEPREPAADSQPPAAEPPMVPAETAPAVVPSSIEPLTREQLKLEYRKRTGIIKEQLSSIQQSFLVIAFQLYWIKENVMYPSAYRNIYEFADVEYGISRSTCGNLIYIVDTYAERDDAGRVLENLQERYRDFSASQLVAMAGMPEEVREKVKPDMSVRMINRMRKQDAQARLGSGRDAEAPAEKDTAGTGAGAAAPEKESPAAAGTTVGKSAGETPGRADIRTDMTDGAPTGTDNPAAGSVPPAEGAEIPGTGSAGKASGEAQGQDTPGTPMPAGTAMGRGTKGQEEQAQPEPGIAQKPGAQQEHLKVFSTLLSFNSYSRYEKEQEYLRTLIKNVFDDNGGAVTVKVIYEKETA